MTHDHDHKANLLSSDSGGFWNVVKIILIVGIFASIFFVSGVYVWAQSYEGRVPPNVFVGDIAMGGLYPDEALQLMQERTDNILNTGAQVLVNDELVTVSLATLVTTDVIEHVEFDLESTVNALMNVHEQESFKDSWVMFAQLFETTTLSVDVLLNTESLQENVMAQFPDLEELSTQATFTLDPYYDGEELLWSIEIIEGRSGTEFQWDAFFEQMEETFSQLSSNELSLALIDVDPLVTTAAAKGQENQVLEALAAMPYVIEYDGASWTLSANTLSTMLLPGEDGKITLDPDIFSEWMQDIVEDVSVEERDARLVIEDGRVSEFVESREGLMVEVNQALTMVISFIQDPLEEAVGELIVSILEPTVKTGDVNDLGITQILGSGTSSYRWSPSNRRANIQRAVDLLNGLLIAPGETFSLIQALNPFTFDNGYLPELVIKGDKIEPELGGGLCQIGTTTFRAVMNAGLEVTERRNHSLVVSYYNDLTNGLPGTDATIYEPAPDFKFTNDTGHHVLFQAENLTENQELRFTFWGTSDGRQGSYAPPVVSRWIPVGETQYIESEDLEPGEETCQEAHIGADASFVYTVVNPDGEVEETTFTSHYRPLPRICLVGKSLEEEEDEEDQQDEEQKNDDDETVEE